VSSSDQIIHIKNLIESSSEHTSEDSLYYNKSTLRELKRTKDKENIKKSLEKADYENRQRKKY